MSKDEKDKFSENQEKVRALAERIVRKAEYMEDLGAFAITVDTGVVKIMARILHESSNSLTREVTEALSAAYDQWQNDALDVVLEHTEDK